MYAAKVRLGLDGLKDGASELQSKDGHEENDDAENLSEPWSDSIEFTAGNPRVEHVTGTVHLYRQIPESSQHDVLPALPVSLQFQNAWAWTSWKRVHVE